MDNFFDEMKETVNYTITENGAIALNSTLNAVLDAFGSIGAMRGQNERAVETFMKAFYENKKLAMKLLFYVRDVRGGMGEREIFRQILKRLSIEYPDYVINNIKNIPTFGRWDDVVYLIDTPVKSVALTEINDQWMSDVKAANEHRYKDVSLLAKWLPSVNASSEETRRKGKIIAHHIFSLQKPDSAERFYRKNLAAFRRILDVTEVHMSKNEWSGIRYESVPSKAALNYRNAFARHDEERYDKYLEDVALGKANINSSTLFPVDLVHKIISDWRVSNLDNKIFNAQWKALPNYFNEEETGLCVVDVSGSMSGTPMEVAISLGLYAANKAKGPFHNKFITFESNPSLVEVNGENIVDDVRITQRAHWGGSTNIEAVFNLILDTAIRNNCKQNELPSKLYIISDMQFNEASGQTGWFRTTYSETFMTTMKRKFREAGYEIPSLVYWNVRASNCGMFQETVGGENCCMVSGYSSAIFKAVIDGTEYVEDEKGELHEKLDPMTVMLNTLNSERYECVWVG